MLPFDSESNRETARQTVQEPVPFKHKLWEYVSNDAKDIILKLLNKDSESRPPLTEILVHPWICRRNVDMLKVR